MSKKQQLINEIIGYIERMEHNTFLLPNSWSDEIQMATREFAGSIRQSRKQLCPVLTTLQEQ